MALAREKAKEIIINIPGLEETISIEGLPWVALSGVLLQIVEQGISLVRGSLATCPSGRLAGSEKRQNVLLASMKPSSHFE